MDGKEMEIFRKKLESVPDSYDDFVAGMVSQAVSLPQSRAYIESFIDSHPQASTSDIIEHLSEAEWFYDDADEDDISDEEYRRLHATDAA